ncbi:hypothetical protein V2J09_015242 [Rumex salicifolius]
MPNWSAENATRAYLRALKMGKRGKEPDVAEFISALAAGNNAQLMVEVCSAAGSTTLALVAAAQQTGGKVVCIVSGQDELSASRHALGPYTERVELVAAEGKKDGAGELLLGEYKGADFVLVDCHVGAHVFRAAAGCVVVGYNAGGHRQAVLGELKGHYLPIGGGLLVARVSGGENGRWRSCGGGKRSKWVVKVDKCTGEEHVFRVISPTA